MAHPSYGPVSTFSPLDEETVYRSPANLSPYTGGYDQPARPGVEMEMSENIHRPKHEISSNTLSTVSSTIFPSRAAPLRDEDPLYHEHITPLYDLENTFVPYKDHTTRQLKHILVGSSFRWIITLVLCAGYAGATQLWRNRGAQTEGEKKTYNTITTGISIALGLNIASAFKDIALNMRWPILSLRKRNLVELDLILHADSLTKLAKLAFATRRPVIIFGCVFWLAVNIVAQAGIAMLSLTYGFDIDYTGVIYSQGNVSIPAMDKFYPFPGDINNARNKDPTIADEIYTAHTYGASAYSFGSNDSAHMPKSGDIYQPSAAKLWNDTNNNIHFVFSDSPIGQPIGSFSVYTSRTINVSYNCESYKVLKNGDGLSDTILVDTIGNVNVSSVPNSTYYFTQDENQCGDNTRCSIVTAFESSNTAPWYYTCNITLGETQHDPLNISWISDDMALIATSAIAQIGYTDNLGVSSQIYPLDTPWGIPQNGSREQMGKAIASYAIGSIAGATIYNPYISYVGNAPAQGVYLHLGHQYFFFLILGLICFFHLLFGVIVAVLANRVMVGPDGHLSMGILLKEITDGLAGVSDGEDNAAFRAAKRDTTVKYERQPTGKWVLKMIDRG